jgi:hypothetical protein
MRELRVDKYIKVKNWEVSKDKKNKKRDMIVEDIWKKGMLRKKFWVKDNIKIKKKKSKYKYKILIKLSK